MIKFPVAVEASGLISPGFWDQHLVTWTLLCCCVVYSHAFPFPLPDSEFHAREPPPQPMLYSNLILDIPRLMV